ncbi:MAG: GIY-YIG nuclease family protein, partial [Candidatus Hadarchaeales archaeon]
MRGIYVLFLRVPYTLSTLIGGLGEVEFRAGNYAYVGSALGGVEKRVGRHLSAEKKLHWHIDYLLLRAAPYDILAAEGEKGKECEVARKLSSELSCVEGFGCSDCGCVSH